MAIKKTKKPLIRKGESFVWPEKISPQRRNLILSTAGVGAIGGALATIPVVCSFSPSDRAKAAGAPVTIDISGLQPGMLLSAQWRRKPIWILHRTPEMLAGIKEVNSFNQLQDPDSTTSEQQDDCKNIYRSIKKEILVVIASCTHLGCLPKNRFAKGKSEGMFEQWRGGFFCPCHSSWFDLAGRVYQKLPAPVNLTVPPHHYLTDTKIYIGSAKPVT